MNITALIKKGLLVVILASSLLSLSSTYAYYTWNRHYTRCWNGRCHHYDYHKTCANHHCRMYYHNRVW